MIDSSPGLHGRQGQDPKSLSLSSPRPRRFFCFIGQCFRDVLHSARLSVFLSRCRICEGDLVYAQEEIVCRDCLGKISRFSRVCDLCGWPMENESRLCGECIVNPPVYRRHVSYSGYHDELRELILAFKYGGVEQLKHLLSGYCVQVFREKIAEPFDYLVPVPPDRGRKREFHPVTVMAKLISKQLGIELLTGYLEKVKRTQPQAELSRSRRLENLNAAFKITRVTPLMEGKKVLLLDDVYTTGTTITKCAELLIKAGAEVTALTLARSL